LLSLHALSASELAIAAAFAVVPGLTVAARRVWTARKEQP
jgi:hypothetical protein